MLELKVEGLNLANAVPFFGNIIIGQERINSPRLSVSIKVDILGGFRYAYTCVYACAGRRKIAIQSSYVYERDTRLYMKAGALAIQT